ncbi:patatin-like phospholipase family protein [Mesonia sp. HuA40]|uniref:patatin-like phospholipase family protein n=1 Tax=Mesonia sp. HuA40 TaxID=2602761 RepID=UPI002107AAC6|nr:patatin-like phospholipase family protein [Mesonia sp. HuA40]
MNKPSLIFLLFCFWVVQLVAQEHKSIPENPRVGVVLSGGGAKGLAHIGVLKAIEESGMRVDYIAGTSMGAIVGSLYATGYTAHQLDSIFNSVNFEQLLQDQVPRNAKSFYEKNDSERYALILPFNQFKLSLPSSLSKGQNFYNLLAQLMHPVRDIKDFSKLPIPFFCMATDVETGKEVVLDKGGLPEAVSASGALPTLFSPVEINGQLLIDGGVTNNYPVRLLRAKNLDYIIGIDVQDSLVNRDKLQSVLEIFTQINNFRTIHDMKEKRLETDVYIKPDISAYTVLSFDKGKQIIKEGEKVAAEYRSIFQEIAKKQKQLNYKHKDLQPRDSLFIQNIAIMGSSKYPRNYIRGRLKINENQKIAYTQLNDGLQNISATGNFKRITYRLLPQPDNKFDLILEVTENKTDTFLRFGLHFDELYRSAALVNFTHKSLLFSNDILSFDGIAGDNFRYDFQYYLDKGVYWSLGLNSRVNQFNKNVAFKTINENIDIPNLDVNMVDVHYFDFTNQFYAETFLSKHFKFGVGAEHKYTRIETETIFGEENQQSLPFAILEESNVYSVLGYLYYDTFDDAHFPTRGFKFKANFNLYLFAQKETYAFSEFSIASGYLGYTFSVNPWLRFKVDSEAGFRIGKNSMGALDFVLGGYGAKPINNFVPFYGYDFVSLSADSYIKGQINADIEFLPKNHFTLGYAMANVENDLFETGNWLSLPDYTGFSFGYGLETILGPIEIRYTQSPERNKSEWFFSLGYAF